MLRRTPLYDFHIRAGARMVDFAGWEMPLLYRGIVEEHEQTRRSGSLFDVSHMGRLYLSGPDDQRFIDRVLTRKVADQQTGQSRYSLVCNAAGGVLDDVIISRDSRNWLLVCNASNREKIFQHFEQVRQDGGFNVEIVDNTMSTAMVAIQGPKVIEYLAAELPIELAGMKRYHFQTTSILLMRMTISRSGYTGEDGVEIIVSTKAAGLAVQMLAGKALEPDSPLKPAGLGARDTLRLEAAMPLYGHELTENVDPLSAGLGWAVDLTKDFIGAEALREIQQSGPSRTLVGLDLEGKRIARQGTPIKAGDAVVGEVTSGTFSPTLQKSIAMAYVEAAHASAGGTLVAEIKGASLPARIVKLPFYKRST